MPIPSSDSKVLGLWTKFLGDEQPPFSDAEIAVAKELQKSSTPFEQFVGRAVLFASSAPNLQGLVDLIDEEAALGFSRARNYARDLLYLQFGFPTEDLLRPSIRTFIFDAARSADVSSRLNVSHLLVKIAKADSEALRLLERLADDSDESVSRNATVYLDQLRR